MLDTVVLVGRQLIPPLAYVASSAPVCSACVDPCTGLSIREPHLCIARQSVSRVPVLQSVRDSLPRQLASRHVNALLLFPVCRLAVFNFAN